MRWFFLTSFILIFISIVISCIYIFSIEKEEVVVEELLDEEEIIKYKANKTILLKRCDTNQIVAMDINDYLIGVVASEMPGTYEIEALKAQAIVARTYTYYKLNSNIKAGQEYICDSYKCCQAYHDKETLFKIWKNKGENENLINEKWNRIREAVYCTTDCIITYNNEIIRAYFHASSPIKTENIDQIWGGQYIPYLKSVDNFEDESYNNRYSKKEISYNEMEKIIKENYDNNFKFEDRNIYICDNTTSGRVKNVKFEDVIISAEKLRVLLGLKSTLFTIDKTNEKIIFNIIGYGHGIGMSQVGANYMAFNGKNYEEIIKYYYTGVEIIKME